MVVVVVMTMVLHRLGLIFVFTQGGLTKWFLSSLLKT
jgi:hypothetical protein